MEQEDLRHESANIKEWSKLKEDEYLSKKFDIQDEKIDEKSQPIIHQRRNVTNVKSRIDKENKLNVRRYIMKNLKLNKDVILREKKRHDMTYK